MLGRTPIEHFLPEHRLRPTTQKPPASYGSLRITGSRRWRSPINSIKVGGNVPNLILAGARHALDLGYYYVQDETNHNNHLLLVRVFPKANYDSLTSITTAVASIRTAANPPPDNFRN